MKPTIYLGIGGTGIKTLAHVKYQFEKEYGVGNIPQEIAFVGFDFQTNMDEDPSLVTDISEDFITVQVAANPIQTYEVGRNEHNKYQWMHKANEMNVDDKILKGARQVRTTGRLYTEITLGLILHRIKSVINRVLCVCPYVDIHMVMSLAGGTGAGSFITIATAIKNEYDNKVNLCGFGVTHGVFEAMNPGGNMMPNVMYNCISSIIDLDYMFTATPEKPIYFEVGGETIAITESVFDDFFIIDNKSDNNYEIRKIDELCEMLGLALYSFGLSGHFTHISHHFSFKMRLHDVKNKIGWVRGLGAYEVVYKGKELAQIYAHKAATVLIHKMRQPDAYIQYKVLCWIEAVGLREDNINDEGGAHDQLTDTICSPIIIHSLKLPSIDQANSDEANKQECQRYLSNLTQFPSDSYIATLLDGFKTKLDEKVRAILEENAGVGNAIKFIELFKTYCEKFKTEIDSEVKTLTRQKSNRAEGFEKAYNTYISEKYGLFTIRRVERNQDLLENLVSYPALEILKLSYEIKRREVASSIYNALLAQAYSLCNRLEQLDGNLKLMTKSLESTLVQKQTGSSALVFEYDLSTKERQTMKVDDADVMVENFVATLGGQSLLDVDSDALCEKMLAYTENLPQANVYKNILLSQVIESLSDEDYKKMKGEIERKFARWLRVNDRGEYVNISNGEKSVADAVVKNWIVSYYPVVNEEGQKVAFRLEGDKDFAKNVLKKDYLPTYSDTTKQRMIFTCIDGCVIPYCIDSLDEMVMEKFYGLINQCKAGQAVFNPHCDKQLFERMKEEDFKLKPEMQDEAMFYWVCAQIFGAQIMEKERIMQKDANGNVIKEERKEKKCHTKLITYFGGKYMYWDENSIPGKNMKWQVLGNTSRRDVAFKFFKTEVLPECKVDFKRFILADYQKRVAYWENFITSLKDVIYGGNGNLEDYIDHIVCSSKSSATYFAQNDSELDLLKEEFTYLSQKLINQLARLK